MTKFVGDAIGARTGPARYGFNDRRRDMDAFLETGVHPEVRRMREEEAMGRPPPPLPDPNPARPHVFFQFSVNRKLIEERVIVELFDDHIPSAASHFLSLCSSSSPTSTTFQAAPVVKILRHAAVIGGHRNGAQDPIAIRRESRLQHASPGAVSIKDDGSQFCFSLARSLHLNDSFQVVGQIIKGIDVVEEIAGFQTNVADDAPVVAVAVARCGGTDAEGKVNVEAKEGEIMERGEGETRNAVQEALRLQTKKRRGEEESDDEDAEKHDAKKKNQTKKKKSSRLDALLLGGDDSE